MTTRSNDRYLRVSQHALLDVEVLRNSKLLVAGAGALGNEVLKGLALLGVGRLIIVDSDVVEESNLTRSILFREGDIGLPKAKVAAERVQEVNPDVQVKAIVGKLESELGVGVIRRVNAVLSCLDSREARLRLNWLSWLANVPFIDGGLGEAAAFYGGVRTFLPPDGPCYECTLSRDDWRTISARYSCGHRLAAGQPAEAAATTPVEASIIGGMQLHQALKVLMDLPVEGGTGYFYNGITCELLSVRYERLPACPLHEEDGLVDNVLCLPEGVSETNADRLLRRVREAYGPEAKARLMHTVVTSLHCRNCDRSEAVYLVEAHLDEPRLACPDCGRRRRTRLVYVLDREGQLGERSLAELGLPRLSGGVVEHATGEAYWECAGDEDSFWRSE